MTANNLRGLLGTRQLLSSNPSLIRVVTMDPSSGREVHSISGPPELQSKDLQRTTLKTSFVYVTSSKLLQKADHNAKQTS